MASLHHFKWLIVIACAIAIVLLITLLLVAGDAALSVLDRLDSYPSWVGMLYFGVIVLIAGGGLWLTWRLLFRQRTKPERKPLAVDEDSVLARLNRARDQGAEVRDLDDELAELERRRQLPVIQIALCGRISTGKTSLLNALVPDAEAQTSVVGGSTEAIQRWRWRSQSGEQVELADVPGSGNDPEHASLARQECLRAHVVVYVCDGDLTRQQLEEIDELRQLNKPMLIAVNKADLFNASERTQLSEQIEAHIGSGDVPVVWVSSGGEETVAVVDADGQHSERTRARAARIEPLASGLEILLAERYEALSALRDQAVFCDISQRLAAAVAEYRETRAAALIDSHSRQAVVGALAAITPGADLVIQGVLATRLVSALGRLYEVPIAEVEIDKLLRLAGGRLRNATSLTLAIAGNGLKAFPGVGTIAGGLVHAVAYGMIFQSLGKAVAMTLAEHARLEPDEAAQRFGELLDDDLEPVAKRFARLALARAPRQSDDA